MKTSDLADLLIGVSLGVRYPTEDLGAEIGNLKEEEWKKLWNYAERQRIWGIISAGLIRVCETEKIHAESSTFGLFSDMREKLLYQYYRMLSFTTMSVDLLEQEKIGGYVLKGITLAGLYPEEGMRQISDADIFIPDKNQFKRACMVLEKNGFEPKKEMWDYHRVYFKKSDSQTYMLELHIRPAGRMAASSSMEETVNEHFRNMPYQPVSYDASGIRVPGLPYAEYAFQLLLHMMNHFLGDDLRFNMLCDWTVFWNSSGKKTDSERFARLLKISGTEKFAEIITGICIQYWGLSEENVRWMSKNCQPSEVQAMRDYIVNIREPGDPTKGLSIFVQSHDIPLIGYAKEIHRQMTYRFPRAKKIVILWPVLWGMAVIIFMINNRRLKRGSIVQILKDAQKRSFLVKEMGLSERGKD